ncbi:hypothetical protein pb186bvf_014294 [Paramecium bursaria]
MKSSNGRQYQNIKDYQKLFMIRHQFWKFDNFDQQLWKKEGQQRNLWIIEQQSVVHKLRIVEIRAQLLLLHLKNRKKIKMLYLGHEQNKNESQQYQISRELNHRSRLNRNYKNENKCNN